MRRSKMTKVAFKKGGISLLISQEPLRNPHSRQEQGRPNVCNSVTKPQSAVAAIQPRLRFTRFITSETTVGLRLPASGENAAEGNTAGLHQPLTSFCLSIMLVKIRTSQ